MSLREFFSECKSIHHGVRAAQEWIERNGGCDRDVSDGTLESLAEATGAPDTEQFIKSFDYAMHKEAEKEQIREQGGLRGWLFG